MALLLIVPSIIIAKPIITLETYPLKYSYYGALQSTTFINDTAITVSNLMTLSETDPIMLAHVDFTAGYVKGDMLHFTDQNGITGEYVATESTGTLTLKGVTTTANYQAALRSVTFKATPIYDFQDSTTAHSRTVRFNVTDSGGAVSDVKTRNIDIETSIRVYTSWVPANIQEDRA